MQKFKDIKDKLEQLDQIIAQKKNELEQKRSFINILKLDNPNERKIIINPENKVNNDRTEDDCNLLSLDVEAIVNAANSSFGGGGGIDQVIGSNLNEGRQLYTEAQRECREKFGRIGANHDGHAVITNAYPTNGFRRAFPNSPIRFVIHTVAPNISGHSNSPSDDEKNKFYDSIRNALELVKEKDIHSLGLPAIGCGTFAWSFKDFFENMFDAYYNFIKNNPDYELKLTIAIYNPPYTHNARDRVNPELRSSRLAINYGYGVLREKLEQLESDISNLEAEVLERQNEKATSESKIADLENFFGYLSSVCNNTCFSEDEYRTFPFIAEIRNTGSFDELETDFFDRHRSSILSFMADVEPKNPGEEENIRKWTDLLQNLEALEKEPDDAPKNLDDEINNTCDYIKSFWMAVYKIVYFKDRNKLAKIERVLNDRNFVIQHLDEFNQSVNELEAELMRRSHDIRKAVGIKEEDLLSTQKILERSFESRDWYEKLNSVAKSKLVLLTGIGSPALLAGLFGVLVPVLGWPIVIPLIFSGVTGVSLITAITANQIIDRRISEMDTNITKPLSESLMTICSLM